MFPEESTVWHEFDNSQGEDRSEADAEENVASESEYELEEDPMDTRVM